MAVLKMEQKVPDSAIEFLSLFGSGSRHFVAIDPRGRMPTIDTKNIGELHDLSEGGYNIYYCPNELEGPRADCNITEVRALWIDDDKGTVDVAKLPKPPSITVNTSPNKFQYLWLVRTRDKKEASNIILGLAQKYDGDTKVHNPSRILRLPGFPNHKYVNSPVVTYEVHNSAFLSWYDIDLVFPKANIEEDGEETQKSKFSHHKMILDMLTGENIHGSRISLALHYVNLGMTKEDIMSLLTAYVEDAIRAGTVTLSRGMERLGNMPQAIDSAIAKVDSESAPLVHADNEDTLFKYTVIPKLPEGGLRVLTEACLNTMRFPNYEIAATTAMHLIGTYGGGLFKFNNLTMSRSRVILAKTGVGKNSITEFDSCIKRELIKANVNPYAFHCQDSYNISFDTHAALGVHRIKGQIIEEAGEMASSSLGAKFESRAFMLKLLTCGTNKALEPKTFSGRTAGNQKANETLKPLWGICYSVLSESVPESYINVIKNEGHFTDGLIPRQEIIFVNPFKPYRNKEASYVIPREAINMIQNMISEFISMKCERGDNPDNPTMFRSIDVSQIEDDLETLEIKYIDKQNQSYEDDIMHAMYSRFFEKVCCTILIQATADAAMNLVNGYLPTPVATKAHFDWAVAYHDCLVSCVVHQSKSGDLADPFILCTNKLYEALVNFGSTAYDKKYTADTLTMSWFTKNLDKSRFKFVATCLERLYNNNRAAFNRDIINHCIDQGWISITKRGAKTNHWKINRQLRK